jgi:hypothetical protein
MSAGICLARLPRFTQRLTLLSIFDFLNKRILDQIGTLPGRVCRDLIQM